MNYSNEFYFEAKEHPYLTAACSTDAAIVAMFADIRAYCAEHGFMAVNAIERIMPHDITIEDLPAFWADAMAAGITSESHPSAC